MTLISPSTRLSPPRFARLCMPVDPIKPNSTKTQHPPTKTAQQYYKNHQNPKPTPNQPINTNQYQNQPNPKTYTPRSRPRPRAAPVLPLATIMRHGAARAAGGLPEGPPPPHRTPRAAAAPPLATLRHGAARAPGGLPEGPPPPPTRDPAPPERGRGSTRVLAPTTPESLTGNRLACEAQRESPRV